jgi:signal transduction histidine kinase
VVLSILPLAVALLAGTLALVLLFSAGRLHDVDRQARVEADTLVGLVETAQVTSPLPVPAGSPLLAQVIDADHTVIAASRSASLVLPLIDLPRAGSTARTFTVEDDPYGAVTLRVRVQQATLSGAPVSIVVAAPLGDVQDALRALKIVLLVVLPILVLGIGALEWAVIGFTLRPVDRLRAAAGRLAADATAAPNRRPDQAAVLPVGPGDDEITRLAKTLNRFLSRLQLSMNQQRDFIADAAHELRSPLASMRVQLDVAQTHPHLLNAHQLAAELSAELDRLTRLTDDLLLLGRLDSGALGPFERIDLSEIAGTTQPPVIVSGNRDALLRLVRNLTANARDHSDNVQTTVATAGRFAELDVDDDGPGIPAQDRDRVFERWTRLDTARDRSSGGYGLGLAIARDIAVAHGGRMAISDSPLGGTRVQVLLPLADENIA